ncbi:cellulose-binding domain-containing protein [Streptomyces sp. WI04-05B]|uniref:cellulose-binding domain-containing protein n=1 Tax=Streptomyces TaxID=1883 RepID=UPI0029BE8452|nr:MULTISPECIES: cellulose-binding domain-containing protein [unclassified Streptomyces]MDX2543485.1 cellulose-binding domain-containing protein [Streptomyces sp. WI04-05B]MDX2589154.1 cellulose-binding domain-containing protein [Streptomyces sp. WI04-05A]MDX3746655.1 cellulose-binding domain-containing protein [Streptomyces sp. AK08-02]
MPDLPTPQDAAEAALFSECWDAVLSYADLCTSGASAGTELAAEAFRHGIHAARAADFGARNTGRRIPRLPWIPLLLAAVRSTATSWEETGQGNHLDPDLRLWLNSDKAARYVGPPLRRPLALRALRDMQEPDAALLWLAEVEALPLAQVARRLGLDPDSAAEELAQVRVLFRDRCQRNLLDTPMSPDCRRFARLLDAVTRSQGAEVPEDLSRHLATCVECAEAAACLRLYGGIGGLPAALAGGVIGWGGLAYLERRRRAAEAGLLGGRGEAGFNTGLTMGESRPRIGRTAILVAAVIVSGLALTVSMMPFDGSGDDAARRGVTDGKPVMDPASVLPSGLTVPAGATPSAIPRKSDPAASPTRSDDPDNSDTEPQGTATATAGSETPKPSPDESEAASCEVEYDLVNEWPDGFQATIRVTTAKAVDGWRIAWSFRDGQQVGQMWDASFTQDGARVTATAADYNRSVAADGTVSFGFLASWQGSNKDPFDFTLNGSRCTT